MLFGLNGEEEVFQQGWEILEEAPLVQATTELSPESLVLLDTSKMRLPMGRDFERAYNWWFWSVIPSTGERIRVMKDSGAHAVTVSLSMLTKAIRGQEAVAKREKRPLKEAELTIVRLRRMPREQNFVGFARDENTPGHKVNTQALIRLPV